MVFYFIIITLTQLMSVVLAIKFLLASYQPYLIWRMRSEPGCFCKRDS